MPPDITTALTADDCGGFAEPADILARLTPDDLHPARLAGPHAWHPWGLSTAPPTDRHLRLVLIPTTKPETADRLLDHLEAQLGRTPWPPCPPLGVERRDRSLHCRDDDARRSLLEVIWQVEADGADHRVDVVDRDGWPILDELAALNDRIRCIKPDEPTRTDLADLTRWVENKMAAPAGTGGIATPLAELLRRQAGRHPDVTERFAQILDRVPGVRETHSRRILSYLAEAIEHTQTALLREGANEGLPLGSG
jgi:hypothetical protein